MLDLTALGKLQSRGFPVSRKTLCWSRILSKLTAAELASPFELDEQIFFLRSTVFAFAKPTRKTIICVEPAVLLLSVET
jgi:hypothetical protein